MTDTDRPPTDFGCPEQARSVMSGADTELLAQWHEQINKAEDLGLHAMVPTAVACELADRLMCELAVARGRSRGIARYGCPHCPPDVVDPALRCVRCGSAWGGPPADDAIEPERTGDPSGISDWLRGDNTTVAFRGEMVDVQVSDSIDDALVVILHGTPDDPLTSTTIEVDRAEAREIIAGLAALL